ncbi:hypothetical protein LUZ62_047289 [Rhynchospora pubera]|uniref:POTRA domain-containing protein n=1 Tax=Rhynchospora pubera TaxID=906938 RepID=A0AAV8FYQ8_9POAL|nr:hypothetical protein LUZ62_047289 [Rhynchospora pubera]
MANSDPIPRDQAPPSDSEETNGADEISEEGEEEEDTEYEEFEEEEEELDPVRERERLKSIFRRLSTDPVHVRVHDVVIKGNTKTKDAIIEAEISDLFKKPRTVQELVAAASIANARLKQLDVFDSVSITLDAGPAELPGTTNVVIEVVEASNPLTGNVGVFSKPEARSWSLEGSLKLKNLFGHADIWDTSGAFGWDQSLEIGTGVWVPRFKSVPTPLSARAFLLSQDWLKFSSYKERLMGLNFGLLSTNNHDLSYNLTWRTLTDPTRMSSPSIRRQLGHNVLSALKYCYKIDRRDSHLRPKSGYAFSSTSQVSGLWDLRGLKFFRQEFDLRAAMPLGFWNAAFNVGLSAGAIFPLGRNFTKLSTSVPDRFFLGGHSSLVCSLGGPSSLLGFQTRGLGPNDMRRVLNLNKDEGSSVQSDCHDFVGGDLAVTAFADVSFDLPLKIFRDAGIHGHAFVCAGNLAKLSEGEIRNFSTERFLKTFRSSAGVGVILPTKFFRVEVNYCHVLKQFENDHGKNGIQFSFSSPL